MKYGLHPEDTRELLQVQKPGSNGIKVVPSACRCQSGVGVRKHIPRDKKGGHGQHNRFRTRAETVDKQQGLMMKDIPIGMISGEKLLTDNTRF